VVRIQTQNLNKIEIHKYKNNLIGEKDKKIIEKIHLINKILAYSAIKIRANPSLPYSILNPDTNSDSPSAKSNGVRFVSATQEINNIIAIGKKIANFIQIILDKDK